MDMSTSCWYGSAYQTYSKSKAPLDLTECKLWVKAEVAYSLESINPAEALESRDSNPQHYGLSQ